MDETTSQNLQEGTENKVLSTAYKVGGWHLRFKAIGSLIMGILLILAGIVLAVFFKSWSALILPALGLVALLGGWLYWKRAKSLVKGRFY